MVRRRIVTPFIRIRFTAMGPIKLWRSNLESQFIITATLYFYMVNWYIGYYSRLSIERDEFDSRIHCHMWV